MSKATLLGVAGVIAAIALMVSGCGSSSSGSTTAPTKAQFVTKLEGLCEEREEERSQMFEAVASKLKPGENLSKAKQTRMIETIIFPSYAKMIANVKSLEAPEGDEAEIEELIQAMEKAQKKVEANPRQAVFTVVMFEEANELARKYGLEHCGI